MQKELKMAEYRKVTKKSSAAAVKKLASKQPQKLKLTNGQLRTITESRRPQ